MATTMSSTSDPTLLLNTQLASALSTLGDAQFWEETISPSTIRTELSSSDPSNPNSTPTLLKGMKWLLASISKGRDVSDFYPHVVKLVGATSLEVRKMVYMYLVQYADHDATTRELSLLSINSFQRGLADSEQLIRALALRVLSSIRIIDILQIQILGVQKCAKDRSPYVRKCAANALAKLSPRCTDNVQKDMLLDIMVQLLNTDTSTMVLSSALIAFTELCPTRLELLHGSFRKICHLLTDMDEWGQVVILDILSRYCRKFFKEPKGWKQGTAERIDRERRVQRTMEGVVSVVTIQGKTTTTTTTTATTSSSSSSGGLLLLDTPSQPTIVKRRVVQKGFYSDEEDESVEEEVVLGPGSTNNHHHHTTTTNVNLPPLNSTGRNILGLPGQPIHMDAEEDMDLDDDHRLLLQSSMPLLKSRNAGVVLGVCSLLYYCGVSSVKARSAMGKALVRIHRGKREIQYVVLTSIRTLVQECPSAFAPFLHDFFVKALDPPPTRIIKIDILVSLALEPAAIEAVLKELRTYIRNADKKFVCASIRGVGRVAELARIVYDRHGQLAGNNRHQERQTANRIALDCLYGLAVITQAGDNPMVVGEAVCVMQCIMTMLSSDVDQTVDDPNHVQTFALRRIVLLLIHSLFSRSKKSSTNGDKLGDGEAIDNDDDDDDDANTTKHASDLDKLSLELPEHAVASAIWTVGEWLTSSSSSSQMPTGDGSTAKAKVGTELVRLLDQQFPDMSMAEKCQAIHLASKLLLHNTGSPPTTAATTTAICEHVLSMGRIDVHPDVKDRARMESGIIQASIGFKYDTENMDPLPATGTMTLDVAKQLLLAKKPAPSFLPVEDPNVVDTNSFRFGTLSSLVGHQARGAYLALPPWSEKNSPKALRDPIEAVKQQVSGVPPPSNTTTPNTGGFYGPNESSSSDDDDDSSDDSSSDSSSSSSSSRDRRNDADSESDSDDDSTSRSGVHNGMAVQNSSNGRPVARNIVNTPNNASMMNLMQPTTTTTTQSMTSMTSQQPMNLQQPQKSSNSSSSDDDDDDDGEDSSSSSSSSSGEDTYNGDISSSYSRRPKEGNLLSMGGQGTATTTTLTSAFGAAAVVASGMPSNTGTTSSSAMDDLRGLVMAPIAVDETMAFDPDIERDSSHWMPLIRPEISSGLFVQARFLRGPTKIREAQLKGLDATKHPNVVCVQLQFGNKKTDGNALRRIRILPKSGGSSGAFALKKALIPPGDIAELKCGQVVNLIIGLEFASVSNREGDLVARFDIKTSTGGGIPIELRPTLGDLLVCPNLPPSVTEFDAAMNRLQGFQRVTATFQSSSPSHLDTIPNAILKSAALTPVGKTKWQNNQLRFIGGLPGSNELVWVRLDWDPTKNNNSGTIAVCCDNAMAVNSIMAIVKHALST